MEWPLFDLRLSIADVALRPVTDADLSAISAMFPDDDEQGGKSSAEARITERACSV